MLEQISFMTEKEKKAVAEEYEFLDKACEIDKEEMYKAFFNGSNINTLIHIQLLKAQVCRAAKMPRVLPFTAKQYAHVASQETEEALREALCTTLAEIALQGGKQ